MLDPLFRPASVAVIGASNRRLTIGYRIIENLLESGFNGAIYPVNPRAAFVRSIPAYPSILDVPGEVDLAHVIVKNTSVPGLIEECGRKGVKVAIINTSGFREVGGEGIALERKLVETARAHGVRLFGPNCQGIINTDPEVSAYCNFTFTRPLPGPISLVAQSGGVAEVINNRLFELGAGLRMYASNGNACDISIPEIIEYWGDDPGTKVIICHIESLADPAELLRVARKVGRRKPILGFKSGRTRAGARAVSSHTGGLMKEDTTTRLVFREAGMLSFRDQASLCEAAYALAAQPLPAGKRIGVVTNAGGPAIIGTDELVEAGCSVPELGEATRRKLRAVLLDEACVTNPVDLMATGRPEHFREAVRALLDDERIDGILLSFITPFFVDCEGVAREVAALVRGAAKPVVGVVMTRKASWQVTLRILRDAGIPVFDLPESGARALAAMTRVAEGRAVAKEAPAVLSGHNRGAAAAIVDEALARDRSFVPQERAFKLLAAYGLKTPPAVETGTLEQTLEAAAEIGYPVVLKIERDDVVHKSEAGGVIVGLRDEAELRLAFEELAHRFPRAGSRFLVAAFVTGNGPEVILGGKQEEGLGPVIAFGLGGIFVEALHDVEFALAPLSMRRARELIRSIRGYPALAGARGRKPVDVDRLADALRRFALLLADNPRITEADVNPLLAPLAGGDPIALDARFKVEKSQEEHRG